MYVLEHSGIGAARAKLEVMVLQGGSTSASGSQESSARRFVSQGSLRSYIGRVCSNDSLSRHQWNALPATGASFASRGRSHPSMDRLQEEEDQALASSDDRIPTPLDQMHDITEELTTQLTGRLASGGVQLSLIHI